MLHIYTITYKLLVLIRNRITIMKTYTLSEVFNQTPADLILTLRRAHWSQEDIANAADTTQATICRILSGVHRDPKYSVVRRLQETVLRLHEMDGAIA